MGISVAGHCCRQMATPQSGPPADDAPEEEPSPMVVVRQLNEQVLQLETQVVRYLKNCRAIESYQDSALSVCETWSGWLSRLPQNQSAGAKQEDTHVEGARGFPEK